MSSAKTKDKLSAHAPVADRREQFCQEYLKDFNATQAAARAGYSERSARNQGTRLMQDDAVKMRLETLQAELRDRNIVAVDRVLAEYAKIGYMELDVRKLFDSEGNPIPLQDLDDAAAAQIAGVEITETFKDVTPGEKGPSALVRLKKYRLHPIGDKKSALDSMARHLGLFKDTIKLEVSPIRELMDYVNQHPKPLPAKP